MIQAPQSKLVETKAPVGVDGSSKAAKALGELEGLLETSDFANELEASIVSSEMKVAPVEVSSEQALELPSSLVNQSGNIDTATPKIFDPALTKGVEKLIEPTTTQVAGEADPIKLLTDADVLEIANTDAKEIKKQIAQALLKTPQVNSGRAPAIDFAQKEIDPQLLNMEDFVEQKNLIVKRPLPNAYGMKTLSSEQKVALENGLKSNQVVSEIPSSGFESTPVNSQQFILNMMSEQNINTAPTVNEAAAASKIFDMSNIKSTNTNEIISQISDYVVQAKAAKEPTVNMRVNHDQLGVIDITVSKAGTNQEAIAINIGAHSTEGKSFFLLNGKDLVSHMTSMGHNISEMKVETPSQMAKSDFDFSSQAGRNQQGEKQFGSEQGQRRQEQDRRQDLWKLLNQEAA